MNSKLVGSFVCPRCKKRVSVVQVLNGTVIFHGCKCDQNIKKERKMKTELNDCPFCGGGAMVSYDYKNCPIVDCQSCGASTGRFEKLEDAIEAWNNRVSHPTCDTCDKWAAVNDSDKDGECAIGRGHITNKHYCADYKNSEIKITNKENTKKVNEALDKALDDLLSVSDEQAKQLIETHSSSDIGHIISEGGFLESIDND